MMRRRSRSALTLPWEERGRWLLSMLQGARWMAILAALSLATLLWVVLRYADLHSRVRLSRDAILELRRAATDFRADAGRCPRSVQELLQLGRGGKRYLNRVPRDGWGRELYMQCPGFADPEEVDVVSAGPSGVFTDDDNIY